MPKQQQPTKPNKKTYNLPAELKGIQIVEWSPDEVPGRTPPTQVHMILHSGSSLVSAVIVRIQSAAACDEIINALVEHRIGVWGEAGYAGPNPWHDPQRTIPDLSIDESRIRVWLCIEAENTLSVAEGFYKRGTGQGFYYRYDDDSGTHVEKLGRLVAWSYQRQPEPPEWAGQKGQGPLL